MAENEEIDNTLPEITQNDTLDMALSLLTPGMANHFSKIPQNLMDIEECKLKQLAHPTELEEMLRESFWREIRRVSMDLKDQVRPVNIYGGICTKIHFYTVLGTPEKAALILRCPPSHKEKSEYIISKGTAKLMEVLEGKVLYPNGHIDAKATKAILDVVAYFESRVRGSVTQKIESKNLNVEVKRSEPAVSMKELDQKLASMREAIAVYTSTELVLDIPERVKDVEETSS